jgi:hypothetical protein
MAGEEGADRDEGVRAPIPMTGSAPVAVAPLAERPRLLDSGVGRHLVDLAGPMPDGDLFGPTIVSALTRFTRHDEAAALGDLVGVGEGLTPRGDDLLVGILAGLDLVRLARLGADRMRRDLAGTLGTIGLTGTTRLSGYFLESAARGLYPAPVSEVLEAAARNDPADPMLEEKAAALAAVGHSSGREILRGIGIGLSYDTPVLNGGEPWSSTGWFSLSRGCR